MSGKTDAMEQTVREARFMFILKCFETAIVAAIPIVKCAFPVIFYLLQSYLFK